MTHRYAAPSLLSAPPSLTRHDRGGQRALHIGRDSQQRAARGQGCSRHLGGAGGHG